MTRTNFFQATLIALVLLTPVAAEAAPGPFASLAGAWTGNGTLTMASGATESLRCRANYNVSGGGEGLKISLRCASQSYNFDLGGNVTYQDGRISGTWSETSRNVSGSISGRATANQVEAAATSEGLSANLSLKTNGNRQSVSIRSTGGADIAGVSLDLSRR
jgi:hypothetical protein